MAHSNVLVTGNERGRTMTDKLAGKGDPQITAMLTKQNVFMGDHAETVTRGVRIDPNETVKDLLTRELIPDGNVEDQWFITLRVAPDTRAEAAL